MIVSRAEKTYIPVTLSSRFPSGARMSDIDMDLASGIAAFEAKEFANAKQLLYPLAEQGNAEAQYRLAIMAQVGLGMVKNCASAVKWMRAAAGQGFGLAQHGLGFMYLQGECTKTDPAEAAKWFRLAADQGLSGSQATLAMMYGQGIGVERDLAEAGKCQELAATTYLTGVPRRRSTADAARHANRLLPDPGRIAVGLLVPAVCVAGRVPFIDALLFALGIVQIAAGPAVDVFDIHALFLHLVDRFVIVVAHVGCPRLLEMCVS